MTRAARHLLCGCALIAAGVLGTGCFARLCTDDYQSNLTGTISNGAGQPLFADSVERLGPGNQRIRCEVSEGGYSCGEGRAGRAELVVQVGEREWRRPVQIRDYRGGCHNAEQEVDFTLAELPTCTPLTAVEGALVGPAGASLPSSLEVSLQRGSETNGPWQQCDVSGGRYTCPAINYHSTTRYTVHFKFGVSDLTVDVDVVARDCQVQTVTSDLVLGVAPSALHEDAGAAALADAAQGSSAVPSL